MICTKCGVVGADVRPNWKERARSQPRRNGQAESDVFVRKPAARNPKRTGRGFSSRSMGAVDGRNGRVDRARPSASALQKVPGGPEVLEEILVLVLVLARSALHERLGRVIVGNVDVEAAAFWATACDSDLDRFLVQSDLRCQPAALFSATKGRVSCTPLLQAPAARHLVGAPGRWEAAGCHREGGEPW